MKTELGIEIKCENCTGDVIPNHDCPKCGQESGCEICEVFTPKEKAYEARIAELQAERDKLMEFVKKIAEGYSFETALYEADARALLQSLEK